MPIIRTGKVLNWGAHHRYEIVQGLEPGDDIVYSRTLRDQQSGLAKVSKIFAMPNMPAKKTDRKSNPKPVIFLGFKGFEMGYPLINIRRPNGKVEVVEALGYQFVRGKKQDRKHGDPICSWQICSRAQEYETTIKRDVGKRGLDKCDS